MKYIPLTCEATNLTNKGTVTFMFSGTLLTAFADFSKSGGPGIKLKTPGACCAVVLYSNNILLLSAELGVVSTDTIVLSTYVFTI